MNENIKLIIFDLDGTLADRDSGQLLPGVAEWFAANKDSYRFALATNQGAIGLRYWMERDGFGEPGKYPDETKIMARIEQVIGSVGAPLKVYVCFAYQARSGKWSPFPPGLEDRVEWMAAYRKPAPGMLLQAMRDAGIDDPSQALFVGNGPEDEEAAARAGIGFVQADEFFGRG